MNLIFKWFFSVETMFDTHMVCLFVFFLLFSCYGREIKQQEYKVDKLNLPSKITLSSIFDLDTIPSVSLCTFFFLFSIRWIAVSIPFQFRTQFTRRNTTYRYNFLLCFYFYCMESFSFIKRNLFSMNLNAK